LKLFFDINVVLDVLVAREPWAADSAAVLSLPAQGRAEGFVGAHTVTTLHYLLRKHLGHGRAAESLVSLLGLVRAVSIGHETLLKALSLGWGDFEDAVQAICALEVECDYFISRDPRALRMTSLAVVSPGELVAILRDSTPSDR
jgi:hypothetical protein